MAHGMVVCQPRLGVQRPTLDSVGGGLRFLLPSVAIPAIRFDVGYGLDVRDYAITFTIASE
jgi:hypothetical protein